jgi:hypothetical protein
VKEMERRIGNDWACMVEPTSKFIQCFGVTKRPDQYIRLTCGPDRVRIWRITDMEQQARLIDELKQRTSEEKSQILADHVRRECELSSEKKHI